MARVVLHVGAHKTATSFLQGSFHLNRNRLESAGIFYPDMPPQRAQHALTGVWIDLPRELGEQPISAEQQWQELVREYAAREGVLFLSSERFSRLENQRVDMADLARRLAPFEAVKLVYTVRQQVDLVPSIWSEVSKSRPNPPEIGPYLRRVFDQGMAGGVPVDHQLFYDHMLTGFAPEQIHLLDYEQISGAAGGVLGAFLRLLGSDLNPARFQPIAPELANISPDPLAFWLTTRIWPGETPDSERIARVRMALGPKQLRSSLLSQAERAQVIAHFEPLNAALVARVQPWQPGFSLSPPAAAPALHRDQVDDQVWARIAAALYEAPAQPRSSRFKLARLRPHLKRLLS
jgi:hypothetical protein